MLKKLLIGTVLLSTSLFSQAGIISVIDGADMEGMQVTAFFANGGSETQTWLATGADSGAATSVDWSLSLSGQTFGNLLPSGGFDGVWEFNNISLLDGIVGIQVQASVADIYFDIIDTTVETVSSNTGRSFIADNVNNSLVSAAFTDVYSAPDLFGTMNINWNSGLNLAAGQTLQFFVDTDKTTVSEPATALVFLSGLLALVSLRRKA
jgi:hypothetical protein